MQESKKNSLLIVGVSCILVAICIIVCGVIFKKGEKKPDNTLEPVKEINYLYEYGLFTKNQVNNIEEDKVPTSSTPNGCSYKLENKELIYNGKSVAEDVKLYICDTLDAYYLNNNNELYYIEKQGDLNTSYLLAKDVKEFRTVSKQDDYDFAVYVSENGYDIHQRVDKYKANPRYLIYKKTDGKEFFIDNVDNKSMDIKYLSHIDVSCSNKEIPSSSTYNSDELVVNIVNDKSIVKNLLKDENGNDLVIKDALMASDLDSNGGFYYNKIYVLDENDYLYEFNYDSIKSLRAKKLNNTKVSKYFAEAPEAQVTTTITFEDGKEEIVNGEFVFYPNYQR